MGGGHAATGTSPAVAQSLGDRPHHFAAPPKKNPAASPAPTAPSFCSHAGMRGGQWWGAPPRLAIAPLPCQRAAGPVPAQPLAPPGLAAPAGRALGGGGIKGGGMCRAVGVSPQKNLPQSITHPSPAWHCCGDSSPPQQGFWGDLSQEVTVRGCWAVRCGTPLPPPTHTMGGGLSKDPPPE